MASSFTLQIPVVIYVLQQLNPATVLDVGKGFGKYAFLIHEYVGVSMQQRPDAQRTLAEQSSVTIDAVEVQPDYLFPHLADLYRDVLVADIGEIYSSLHGYEVVLMADVIEHLDKTTALAVLHHFLAEGSVVLITTPKKFFHQSLYDSKFEEHLSHWSARDFSFAGYVDWQNVGPGTVYLLSPTPKPIRGFGSRPVTRARRVAKLLRDEFV